MTISPKKRGHLIFVPQLPITLRYQEWWLKYLPYMYRKYFKKVTVLGNPNETPRRSEPGHFSAMAPAVAYEATQIEQYINLKLEEDSVLLLADISFPGLFPAVLAHKRPPRAFAVCHATSLSRYDLFYKVRSKKYPLERATAGLFDGIFVATEYHRKKLGWPNLTVVRFPPPPLSYLGVRTRLDVPLDKRPRMFASVARVGMQKVTQKLEAEVRKDFGIPVERPNVSSWNDYYKFLSQTKYLIITAKEETYGYQVIDALLSGTIPIAPNNVSYPELLSPECLYKAGSGEDLFCTIRRFETHGPTKSIFPGRMYGWDFYEYTSRMMLGV